MSHVRIHLTTPGRGTVEIDGVEIKKVRRVVVVSDAEGVQIVCLQMVPTSIDVDAEQAELTEPS